MYADSSWITLVIVALIALLAFGVQGFTGFGSSLILAPLLLFVLDLKTAVVASAIVQVPIGIGLTYATRHTIDRHELTRLLPISALGVVLGAIALVSLEVDWLKRLCGVVTAIFALRILLLSLRQHTPQRPWPSWAGYLAGMIGGILGGLFGTSGPPVILFLERQLSQKAALRATLLAYFLVINLLRVLGYTTATLVTWPVIGTSLAMIPASVLGAYVGTAMQQRTGERVFRLIVALVLLGSGLMLAIVT